MELSRFDGRLNVGEGPKRKEPNVARQTRPPRQTRLAEEQGDSPSSRRHRWEQVGVSLTPLPTEFAVGVSFSIVGTGEARVRVER